MSTARLLLLGALLGCASTREIPLGDRALRALEAPRLERAVLDAVASRGLGLAAGRRVRIAGRRELEGTACIGATLHCVTVLSAEARAGLRGYVPERPADDALLSVPGAEGDRGAQVLVIEMDDLRYQPDPGQVSADEPSAQEIEDRVRRRVTDWLAWLASQGALPR